MITNCKMIFFIIVFIVVFFKWIFFLLSLFFIRKVSIHRFRQNGTNHNSIDGDISTEKTISLKRKIVSIIDGYIRYSIFLVGSIPSHHIRDFLYKYIYLVEMKDKSVIYFGAEIRAPYKLHIGKGSIIGDKAVLDARRGGIWIGENVNIGSFVKLWTGQHDYNDPYFRSMPSKRGPIKIENRVWIGPNVTILHDVTIGEGAVIAAGAVVTKSVEPYTLVGGIPAKKIGERTRNLKYEFSGDYIPFY